MKLRIKQPISPTRVLIGAGFTVLGIYILRESSELIGLILLLVGLIVGIRGSATPIINSPEVAIIGVNKIRTVPVWGPEGVRPRQVMNLSSSFDHRVIDGWDAASFIQAMKRMLENPATLFLKPNGA